MSLQKISLRIWTPDRMILHAGVDKVMAEAPNGFFCLLPRHVDYLAGLVPGILSYTEAEEEHFIAVDRGILVKCGFEVMVSVRNAIPGDNLDELEQEVQEKFQRIDQKEAEISMAMNQLEADFIRRFAKMNEQRG
ncbi:F0F1 ATP synthase subunit epsilon [Aliifodinibius sp. S!AR15-10]|uniref:F0F1 ATP synthase subunit epsilon n=1 Tax=Aliifodinibius sp. S!AR15-10 TaxID=2950437 RepID=UPI00285D4C72|nr:F0F1 ATP synthase subunit epsilon [Aliifodinibius sp. S!AR15-10]MDR8393257.1 F0F1 ATP synthase subunit epsilon [Aliifodinibius sp. S!AR15-10]